jgi:hypothetical protein
MRRRAEIYLDEELNEALVAEARKRGMSKAALIRLAARELLNREGQGGDDGILGIAGLGKGVPVERPKITTRF